MQAEAERTDGRAGLRPLRSGAKTSRPHAYARICGVGTALPEHYYDQEALLAACKMLWNRRFRNPARLEQLHRAVLVQGRHLALPIGELARIRSFAEANDAYIRSAVDLGTRAVADALARSGLTPPDLHHIFFVSVTGLATPSIDARIANRLQLRSDIKRTPLFGLGCVAGAAGIARAADYVRAYPREVAVLVAVELCSLTLQRKDISIANLISSGLFGDGAAAVIVAGREVEGSGPEIVAARAVLYPDTEELMGWEISQDGFRVILSADIPRVVREHLARDVDRLLSDYGLERSEIRSWVCHPGGPRVLDAVREALDLRPEALEVTWDSLRRIGNVSSVSVLMVLEQTMRERRPEPGTHGLLLAMGPGFGLELVLLRW